VPAAGLSDLSRTIFENEYFPAACVPDVLESNNWTYEERLATCKMVVSSDDSTPTISGLLAIGKSPQDFIPGACIQFLRINGTQLIDDILDAETIGGALVEMLHRTEEKMYAHNMTAMDVTSGAIHKKDMLYPFTAIRQILYNAVMHRVYEQTNAPVRVNWFSDRIEIISPGGPYGNVTPENFGQPGIADYRNPNLCAVMKSFGFVQAFGRGIILARSEMKKNGNPEPVFITDQNMVLCILRGKQ
jgi:ATP-dependent DNA helicase RecG